MNKLFPVISTIRTHYHFKPDFQNLDQHTEDKWLIHGTKHRKVNKLQSMEIPCRIS